MGRVWEGVGGGICLRILYRPFILSPSFISFSFSFDISMMVRVRGGQDRCALLPPPPENLPLMAVEAFRIDKGSHCMTRCNYILLMTLILFVLTTIIC